MDKDKQRHTTQSISPEQECWLKKHQVNDNRRLELFKQYEEQKSASQFSEYLEAACFQSSIRFISKNPEPKN